VANARDISFASFNLYNLQLPDQAMYPRSRPYAKEEYEAKLAWAGAALRRLDADVIAFQEVWSRQALADLFKAAGLDGEYELAFIKPGDWDGIAVAGAVRKPWRIVGTTRHKAFPPGFRLRKGKRSMADIQHNPPAADRDAPDDEEAESLPSHEDDAIEVVIGEFSRSPLQLSIAHGKVRGDRPPQLEVFCCHLKSKLATRLDDAEYRDPAIRPHADALGSALSGIRRMAEAAALRIILNGLMARTAVPVAVVGDLNDGQHANALALLSGRPGFRLFATHRAGAGSDTGLYNALALQQLRSLGDVYYTHEHRNVREAIDHVLVSEQFYEFSKAALWGFREMRFLNDHLDEVSRVESDHGLVRAAFDWLPKRPA
jgi:endonuclease/exonuclease/phosphatase family metal-dependent hydrolase